ncbi:16S rRNA (adenine(1518)-N(6)/adenine(1519)-N(6))-dimethyltransferase RsmA [Propionivibrio limicola]|uniref:16S rRNA (adenine(1518)-N(6)/adenine(1519)-N(6))- dimethyltransferase RsmA n=1 Tax=Propionivibrio limicola TaxID=167645 RepID=UPI001290F202|nr:16S rRNA (adenine(1518)-N(6)/adenine(1519)-N(6))-dimethyltransferase RsmA [Propionivibrio limicola]
MSKHIARKRFGQNFLIDMQVISDIVNAVAPRRDDLVVEIGPGLGALTDPLLKKLDHLHVVEIDRDIIARLRQRYPAEKLTIHEGDALAFDFGALADGAGQKLHVVGNLPYNISTPLLFHLAAFAERVFDMHFMLQKEVVERMVAAPGTADFGRLSVMLQYRFVMDWLLDVPPESFDPAPKVDSAVVRLIPRPPAELQVADEALFSKLVAAAFAQRRKMLRNNLKGIVDDAMFEQVGIAPTARAEELSVDDYVRIANALHAS